MNGSVIGGVVFAGLNAMKANAVPECGKLTSVIWYVVCPSASFTIQGEKVNEKSGTDSKSIEYADLTGGGFVLLAGWPLAPGKNPEKKVSIKKNGRILVFIGRWYLKIQR